MRSIACVAVLCLFSLWGYSKSRALRIRAMIMRAFGSDIQRLCREIKHRPRELRSRVYEEAFSRGEELDREAAAKGGMFTKVGVLMGIGAALLLI